MNIKVGNAENYYSLAVVIKLTTCGQKKKSYCNMRFEYELTFWYVIKFAYASISLSLLKRVHQVCKACYNDYFSMNLFTLTVVCSTNLITNALWHCRYLTFRSAVGHREEILTRELLLLVCYLAAESLRLPC